MSNDVSDLRRFFANLDSEINTVERNVAHARQEVERATGSLQQSRSKRDDMQAKIATRNSRLAALSAPDQMQGRQQLQSELDQLKAQLDETIKRYCPGWLSGSR